jgi:hypothetical protein
VIPAAEMVGHGGRVYALDLQQVAHYVSGPFIQKGPCEREGSCPFVKRGCPGQCGRGAAL